MDHVPANSAKLTLAAQVTPPSRGPLAPLRLSHDHTSGQEARHAGRQQVSEAATRADVFCDTVAVTGDHPYAQIIATAEQRHCDLIVVASHGREGIQALLLGSETHKVLTHTKIPVLIFHPEGER